MRNQEVIIITKKMPNHQVIEILNNPEITTIKFDCKSTLETVSETIISLVHEIIDLVEKKYAEYKKSFLQDEAQALINDFLKLKENTRTR